MLTKSDVKIIKDLLKGFATKDDLKGLAKQKGLLEVRENLDQTSARLNNVSTKLDTVSTRLDNVSNKLDKVSDKLDKVSTKLDGLYDFSKEAFKNLFQESQDIHDDLTAENLPQRVKRLENLLKTS